MYCNTCHQPSNSCSCNTECGCADSCPIKLDFRCIVYNKDGLDASTLTNLNLPNGSTLKLFAESVDVKMAQLNVINFNLPFLRQDNVINTLQQFCEATDTALSTLTTTVDAIVGLSNVPLTVVDSSSLDFTASGTLNHTLTGVVKISASANNLVSILSDGLFVIPQTVSFDYGTKILSISNGNSIDLSSALATPSGWLGNVSSDPSTAVNGNYWFNTATGFLRIKVNNILKTIITS